VVVGLVIAKAFLSVANEENNLSMPITYSETIIATLLTIPTLILGILVMVGLRPVNED
jgi:hypothetical protein